jgi:hypothetical protein
MKRIIIIAILALVLIGVTTVFAGPARNISAKKHPNLAAAQSFVEKAYNKITMAQKANEFDLGGHAQKAKELLEQASAELKLAAETANANK